MAAYRTLSTLTGIETGTNVRQPPVPANPAGESAIERRSTSELEAARLSRLCIEDWGTPAFVAAFGKHADTFTTKLTENSDDAVAYMKSMGMLNDKGHRSALYGGAD